MTRKHPAKFSDNIMDQLAHVLLVEKGQQATMWVLDPFAGVGRIHELRGIGIKTVGIEIEPEWADQSEHTMRGDAHSLPFPDGSFDAICTSPCYGNRMSDNFKAKDSSKRHTYRAYLGREVDERSSGKMQWGPAYQAFHIIAWTEATRVLKPGGMFVLNTSNHIRNGEEQLVTEWHGEILLSLGYKPVGNYQVTTPRNRFGANRDLRVEYETIGIWRKP